MENNKSDYEWLAAKTQEQADEAWKRAAKALPAGLGAALFAEPELRFGSLGRFAATKRLMMRLDLRTALSDFKSELSFYSAGMPGGAGRSEAEALCALIEAIAPLAGAEAAEEEARAAHAEYTGEEFRKATEAWDGRPWSPRKLALLGELNRARASGSPLARKAAEFFDCFWVDESKAARARGEWEKSCLERTLAAGQDGQGDSSGQSGEGSGGKRL